MAEYIEREKLMEKFCWHCDAFDATICRDENCFDKRIIDSIPAADVQPVVRCKDCRYWKDCHVRCPDGRERQYLPEDYEDIDGNKFLIPSVTADVGINVGSQCLYESNRGWACDKTVFRNADDYCSRAEKRTSSYESWWGICDGWYALESGD